MKTHKPKFLFLLIGFLTVSFNAVANDTIQFTWEAQEDVYWRSFKINATAGESFTVDWGDDSGIEIKTGTGEWQFLSHYYFSTEIYTVIITGISTNCLFTRLCVEGENINNYIIFYPILDIDLRASPSLEYLDCNNNLLSSLDLSNNLALTYLDCSFNKLSSLDLSKNLALTYLNCFYNYLSNLDLSNNVALKFLECSHGFNKFTSLDLSNNVSLEYLGCVHTHINFLDVRNSVALKYLDCSYSNLGNLDVSNNVALKYLACSYSNLSNLDVSNNTVLEELECFGNKLISLDVRDKSKLASLICFDNKLVSIDVNNTIITFLWCSNNSLHLSELYNIQTTIGQKKLWINPQILVPKTIKIDDQIDFSNQKEFGNVVTVFTVEKNGSPASQDNYTIIDGIITFKKEGNYKVVMTNSIIISSDNNQPAKVIAEFNVNPLSIVDNSQELLKIEVYPNPTIGELTITNYELLITGVEIYDVFCRKVGAQFPSNALEGWQSQANGAVLNISHLQAGLYFVKIFTESGTIVKKIIKQ